MSVTLSWFQKKISGAVLEGPNKTHSVIGETCGAEGSISMFTFGAGKPPIWSWKTTCITICHCTMAPKMQGATSWVEHSDYLQMSPNGWCQPTTSQNEYVCLNPPVGSEIFTPYKPPNKNIPTVWGLFKFDTQTEGRSSGVCFWLIPLGCFAPAIFSMDKLWQNSEANKQKQ